MDRCGKSGVYIIYYVVYNIYSTYCRILMCLIYVKKAAKTYKAFYDINNNTIK
jgi:hypothetical protein